MSAEQTAREELAGVLGQQRVEAMREKEGLLMQVTLDLIGFLLLKIYIHTYIHIYIQTRADHTARLVASR